MAMSVGENRLLLVISINTIIPSSNDIYNDDENNVKRRHRPLLMIKAMHKKCACIRMLLQNKSVSPFFLEIVSPNLSYINSRASMKIIPFYL